MTAQWKRDRDKLRLMVTNLLSNAIVHGKRGQGIRCFATQEKGCVKLTIANRSDELVESDLPYLFDRFWQKDPARSAQQYGGLGLSIVQALARLLDIEVTVGSRSYSELPYLAENPPAVDGHTLM